MEQEKASTGLLIKILIPVIAVLCVGFGIFCFMKGSPKAKFIGVVDAVFEPFEKVLETKENDFFDYNRDKDTIVYDGDLKLSTSVEELDFLNDIKLNYTVGIDPKEDLYQAGFGLNSAKEELFNINSNFSKEKVLVDLGKIFDKTIKITKDDLEEMLKDSNIDLEELEEYLKSANVNMDDVDYILKELKSIIKSSLKKAKYETTSETTEVGDENVKAKRITLSMSEENLEAITEEFFEKLLKNDKLLEKIANLIGQDKDDVIDLIEDAQDNLDVDDIADEDEQIVIWTKGILGDVIKFALVDDDDELITYSNYKDIVVIEADKQFKFYAEKGGDLYVKIDGEKVLTGTVNSFEDDDIDIDFKVSSIDGKGKFIYKVEKKKIELSLDLTAKYAGDDIKVKLSETVDKKDKNIFDYSSKISLQFPVDYDDYSFDITASGTITVNGDLKKVSDSNSINIKDLSEEDFEKMQENLMNIAQDSELFETIEGLISGLFGYGDDPYTTDCGPFEDCEYEYPDYTVTIDDDYDYVYTKEYDKITDESLCGSVYTTYGYTFFNEKQYDDDDYVGEGEMIDGYCQIDTSNYEYDYGY